MQGLLVIGSLLGGSFLAIVLSMGFLKALLRLATPPPKAETDG